MTTYAINLATESSTRYTNYGFDSFCRGHDWKYYGIKSDGIYLLEGDNDAGTPIDATVDFGDINFGSSFEKRLLTAYAGVSSETPMQLSVTQEGETYDYPARASDEVLKVQRFDVGRGLRANYFGLAIGNTDGGNFTLDSAEFSAIPTSRRI